MTGRVAKSLQEHVNGCIVLDKSFEMLQQAKINSNKLMLVQGLSEALPFRTNSVKQIFLNDALHHIRKQKETLQECYRVLTPKGKLIIREFDRNYFWNKFLITLEKVLRFGSKFLTPKELECMCLELNFTVYWQKPTKGTFIMVAEKVE